MIREVYPTAFLDSFKGQNITSKSVVLSTKNIYTLKIDKHLDKPLIKLLLEYIFETPIENIQTRTTRKKIRLKGKFFRISSKQHIKLVQIKLSNRSSIPNWITS